MGYDLASYPHINNNVFDIKNISSGLLTLKRGYGGGVNPIFYNNYVNISNVYFTVINGPFIFLNYTKSNNTNILGINAYGGNWWKGFGDNETLCNPDFSTGRCQNSHTLSGFTDYLPLFSLPDNSITINNPVNITYPNATIPIEIETDVESGCSYSLNNLSYIALSTDNNLTHNTSNIDIGGDGEFTVYFRCRYNVDTQDRSGFTSFSVEIPVDKPPNQTDPIYEVSVAYNFTNLNCSVATNILDKEGDNMTVFFNLTVDSMHKAEQILTNQSNGSRPYWLIDYHNYSKGQTVICNITLFDGQGFSITNSTSIIISNSIPLVESFNASSLNRSLFYVNETDIIYEENETVRFSINISDQDTSDVNWYSWFVDGSLKELSQNRFFNWAWDFFSSGLHLVKVVVNDTSNGDVTLIWNVNVLNFVNQFFIIQFIESTPANNSRLNSTSINISIHIVPTNEQPVVKTFIDNTETEFNLGSNVNTKFNTSASAIILNKTGVLEQIFFDGFESGTLNGWSVTGTGNLWSTVQSGSFEGNFSVEAVQTGAGNPTNMTRNISTVGFTNIKVNYYRQLIGMDPADEFRVEYYNGTGFTILEQLGSGSANEPNYTFKSFNLALDADNNPNFRLRFLCENGAVSENCKVDNININGTRQVFAVYGEFMSQIFNASEGIKWENISWVRSLPSGTNLTFQVRSCDDLACSGESFIGPTGLSNTVYVNNANENLNVTNNIYFQYKGLFSTNNGNFTPSLSSVLIKGHTIVASTLDVVINSSYIDFNGRNISMTGSGSFWSYVNMTLRPGNYSYIVYANDSFDNLNVTEKRAFSVPAHEITFNIINGDNDIFTLNETTITCNYSGFSQGGNINNPYGPFIFPPGNWQCTFVLDDFYTKTLNFTADNTKTINVILEEELSLTTQEHNWLKDLYECIIYGQCTAYKYWQSTNQTIEKIWNVHKPTDKSVVIQENFLSYSLSPSQNISINYTLNIPFKEGYANSELLPIRMFFWFTDIEKTKCYSQDKQVGDNHAEYPFCVPLIAQTLGPNNGTVNFVVDLRPNLPAGMYNVTRSIDIDPIENNEPVWINYGREIIGGINVLDDFVPVVIQQNADRVEAKGLTGLTGVTGGVINDIKTSLLPSIFHWIFLIVLVICVTIITTSYLKYKNKLP